MAGSSPDFDLVENEIPTDDFDAETAAEASSASEPRAAEPSLLDSVKEAIGSKEQTPGSRELDPADPAAPKVEGAKAPDAEAPLGELTAAELKAYGPKTQRRMSQLLEQRLAVSTEVEALRPKAQQFEKIEQFAKQNRLSMQDLEVLHEVGALIVGDPDKALERLRPIIAELEKQTGGVLPPDLQERVALGYISKQDAHELVATRNRLARNTEQTEAQKQEAAAAEQTRQFKATVDSATTVANEWEAARKGKDPDWPMKQSRIHERIKLAVYETGFPDTKAKVVTMLDGIYADVNKEFKGFAPKPKEVRVATGGASSRATSAPTSALEAAKQALAR